LIGSITPLSFRWWL